MTHGPQAADPTRTRLLALVLLLPVLALVGIALWLDPDPAGHGTHVQLGLRECSVLAWTGYPCPMCGMTTSFANMVRLRVVSAAIAQPFGVVLFAMTAATGGVAAVEFVQPRGRLKALFVWLGRFEGRLAALFVAGLIGGWMYKLWQMWPS